MTIYTVNYETHYENEGIRSDSMAYSNRDTAWEAMEREVALELDELGYGEDEAEVTRAEDCISMRPKCVEDREWTFRATMREAEVLP